MNNKKFMHFGIAVLLFIVMKLILPVGSEMGLTKAGSSTFAIFIATTYAWLTIGVDWTSFFALGILALTGITASSNIWTTSLGSSLTVLIITVTILSYAVTKTGIAQKLANWFITRKAVENRPYIFLLYFAIANLLVGLFMDATPTTVIFGLIAKNILDELGYRKEDKFSKAMFIIVFWITNIGYCATPISHPIPLLVLGLVENNIGHISYFQYIMVGIPYAILMFIITFLIIRFIVKPDCGKFINYDVNKKRAELTPLSTQGKIVAFAYLIVIFLWLAPDLFKNILPAISVYLTKIGNVIPPLFAVIILCILRIKREPCLSFSEAMQNVPWGVIIFISTIMCFTSVLSLEAGGIKIFLTKLIAPLSNTLSSFGLLTVALIIALLLTNIMSDGVTATIIFSAFAPALISAADPSYSLLAFGVMLALYVGTGFMTPSANAVAPLVFQHGYFTTGDAMKYGSFVTLSAFIFGMGLIWPLANLIF